MLKYDYSDKEKCFWDVALGLEGYLYLKSGHGLKQ